MSVLNQRQYLVISRPRKSYGRECRTYYKLLEYRYVAIAAFRERFFTLGDINCCKWEPIKLKHQLNESSLSYSAARTRVKKVKTYEIRHVTDEEMEEVFNDYFPFML